jgi:short subunit dehydrogenase-like uncharacterized protein
VNADPSGGTLATVFHILNGRVKHETKLGFDPFLKTKEGTKSTNKLYVANAMHLQYSSEAKKWIGPFVMAGVMANCVKRSNALLNYGSNVTYNEAEVYPSFFAGFIQTVKLLLFGSVIISAPLRILALNTFLPKPGE